jgi:hypothetical protein
MQRFSRSGIKVTIGAMAIFVTILAGASTASAQYGPPPPRGYYVAPAPYYRGGLVFGVAVGAGIISASDCGDFCGGGFAGELHIGSMVNRRTAIEFDGWTNIHPIANSDGQTINTIFAGALQYWLNDIFWLKGGIGLGRTQITSDSQGTLTDATGFAVMAAVGVEVVQFANFALDLQARFGHTFYSEADGGDIDNFAFMVGFNWY